MCSCDFALLITWAVCLWISRQERSFPMPAAELSPPTQCITLPFDISVLIQHPPPPRHPLVNDALEDTIRVEPGACRPPSDTLRSQHSSSVRRLRLWLVGPVRASCAPAKLYRRASNTRSEYGPGQVQDVSRLRWSDAVTTSLNHVNPFDTRHLRRMNDRRVDLASCRLRFVDYLWFFRDFVSLHGRPSSSRAR